MGWWYAAGLPGPSTPLEEGLESRFSSIYFFFPFFFLSVIKTKKKKKKKVPKNKEEARAGPRRQTMGMEGGRRGSRQTGDGRFTLHPQRTHWGCPWPFGRTVYWLSVRGAQRPGRGPAAPQGAPWLTAVEASATWGG